VSDSGLLEWLLELSDSVLTYRVRYVQRPEWHSVMDLIVFDDRNPRSAHFQVAKLAKHVKLLPDAPMGDGIADAERVLAACRAADAGRGYTAGRDRTIEPLLESFDRLSSRLSDLITLRYFSHVDAVPRSTVAV